MNKEPYDKVYLTFSGALSDLSGVFSCDAPINKTEHLMIHQVAQELIAQLAHEYVIERHVPPEEITLQEFLAWNVEQCSATYSDMESLGYGRPQPPEELSYGIPVADLDEDASMRYATWLFSEGEEA